MFKSIVVAYDGSAHAHRALEIAAGLAVDEQSRLGIICVIEAGHANLPDEFSGAGSVEHLIDPMPELRADLASAPADLAENATKATIDALQATLQLADHVVARAAQHARSSGALQVDATTATGDPAEQVVKFARDRDADLIVCGSRGLGRIKQLLLGSTSHKIAQLASCSCLTVR